MLLAIPRSAELRPPKTGSEFDPIPAAPLLHGGIRPTDLSWIPAISKLKRPGTMPTNVGLQKHDVRGGSAEWPVPNCISHV